MAASATAMQSSDTGKLGRARAHEQQAIKCVHASVP